MATEERLVDANELVAEFEWLQSQVSSERAMELQDYVQRIKDAPTVDAVEVVHGRWIGYHEADIGYDEYGVRCSSCNFEVEDHEVDFIMNYCPNCGAKMDGGKADDHRTESGAGG